jgi:predicted amidohydrolase YtcJ
VAADFAVIGASIRTLDPSRPQVTAVAITDGMIVAVGDDSTIRAECDGKTELIDGTGMHIVPGLTDSHFHPFWGSLATRGADLTRARTLDDLRAALAAERRKVGPDAWVLGWGLTFEMFSATGIRGDLFADAVDGGLAYCGFFDGHTAVASPGAIAFSDVSGRETFSDLSRVVVDAQGIPTGELQESAQDLVRRNLPQLTDAEKHKLYVSEMKKWNAMGITAIHMMDGSPASFPQFRELEGNGDLTIRTIVPLWQKPETTLDEMRAQLSLRDERGTLWRGGVAKFFIDGVIESGTAWLLEPDAKGQCTEPFWPDPTAYRGAVDLFAKAGFQCATHAVGDAAVRCALDAYEVAGAAPGTLHRIEHIEQLTDEDLPRFAELGVVASMQPLHMGSYAADGSDEASTRLGPERRKRAFRTRDLKDSGAVLALGSDWMVATYDARFGMAWAHLRREGGAKANGCIEPRQALTMTEVLAGYTTEAARAVSEEHLSGQIKEGFRGDLSAFGGDLIDGDPDLLPELHVLLTVVNGRVVHRAE